MQKLIIIRGYPGSGKTSLGKALAEQDQGIFIDHNQILNVITGLTGDDDGIYNEIANLEIAITRKLIDEGKSVIIARGFSSIDSLKPYTEIAKQRGITSAIIRLSVSSEILSKRVKANSRARDSVSIKSSTSLSQWVEQNPFEDYPSEKIIDGDQDLEKVVEATLQ